MKNDKTSSTQFVTLSTPLERRELLIKARLATSVSATVFGRLMNNGKKDGDVILYKKECDPTSPSYKPTSYTDLNSAELLRFLHSEGYDIEKTEFTDKGQLVTIPKRL